MAKLKISKVPVSKRALLQRLNRKLTAQGMVLKSMRGRSPRGHFVLDIKTSKVEFVEPEAYARKTGVLSAWEEVV